MTPGAGTSEPQAVAGPREAGPSDAELEALLAARDRAEEARARALARTLGPGPCPVCAEPLAVARPFVLLRPLVRRPALACRACSFSAEAAPGRLGWALALLLALAAALAGAAAVIHAQRLLDPGARSLARVGGVLLLGGGLWAGWQAQGLGDTQAVARRILRGWRRRRGEPAEAPPVTGWVSENLEAVVVAVVLALIIRHFVMEAFVIPTGSMAPTLLGDHFEVDCPACDHRFPLAKDENELTVRGDVQPVTAHCPLCDRVFDLDRTVDDVHGGNKILVNKLVYRARPPRRYEVVVFKFPDAPWKNYIKRLVGLPGELLRLENGDLFVDGRLARKPDEVQDAIWIPVHDDAHLPKDPLGPLWRPLDDPRDLDFPGDHPGGDDDLPAAGPDAAWGGLEGGRVTCAPRPGRAEWVEYRRRIFDHYGYSRNDHHERHDVADLRIRARVTAADGATVRLAVVEEVEGGGAPRVVSVRLPVGAGEGTFAIEVDGEPQRAVTRPALTPGVPVEVGLAYADDRARLLLDGQTVVAWDDPFAPPGVTARASVRLGAAGAPATFEQVRLDRDIYYVGSLGGDNDPSSRPVRVPPGAYFVMGDNSPNSEDGRRWGFVREEHLIGRAFLVFWPLVPEQVKRIR
ncbi:MAG: signal peptidase I [Planctomycetes bacterium]|nr:signal peptidase I [Planctomycetota bacterium]